jgi:integrase
MADVERWWFDEGGRETLLSLGREQDVEEAPSSMLVREWVAVWWERYAQVTLEFATREQYRRSLVNWVDPRLGGMLLVEFCGSPRHAQEWMAWMEQRGAGVATRKHAQAALSGCVQRAVDEGLVDTNPVRSIKAPKRAARPPVETYSPMTVAGLIWVAGQHSGRDRMLIALLAYGGLRPQEAGGLVWHEWRREDEVLRLTHVLSRGRVSRRPGTKTQVLRDVPVEGRLAGELARRLRVSPVVGRDDPILTTSRGVAAMTANDMRLWSKRKWRLYRDLVLPVLDEVRPSDAHVLDAATPYSLRHHAASMWLRDPRVVASDVAEIMGHSLQTLSTTYAHRSRALRKSTPIQVDEAFRLGWREWGAALRGSDAGRALRESLAGAGRSGVQAP